LPLCPLAQEPVAEIVLRDFDLDRAVGGFQFFESPETLGEQIRSVVYQKVSFYRLVVSPRMYYTHREESGENRKTERTDRCAVAERKARWKKKR